MFETYSKVTNSLVDLVNSSRGINRRTRNALVSGEVRKAFKDAARLAVELGLVVDTISSMSVRLSGGKLLATIAGAMFTRMDDEETGFFSLTSQAGLENKEPPLHFDWHQKVYEREGVHAVLFSHAPVILRNAHLHKLPAPDLMTDAAELLQRVDIADPDAEAIGAASREASMLLIPQFGLLTWGQDVFEAVVKAEVLRCVYEAMEP